MLDLQRSGDRLHITVDITGYQSPEAFQALEKEIAEALTRHNVDAFVKAPLPMYLRQSEIFLPIQCVVSGIFTEGGGIEFSLDRASGRAEFVHCDVVQKANPALFEAWQKLRPFLDYYLYMDQSGKNGTLAARILDERLYETQDVDNLVSQFDPIPVHQYETVTYAPDDDDVVFEGTIGMQMTDAGIQFNLLDSGEQAPHFPTDDELSPEGGL